jgi:hypothetical protein
MEKTDRDFDENSAISYNITGMFRGRRYHYTTSDYEHALKVFTMNNFKSLWVVDKNEKRKLLKTNKDK